MSEQSTGDQDGQNFKAAGNEFDKFFTDPSAPAPSVEDAAVRPVVVVRPTQAQVFAEQDARHAAGENWQAIQNPDEAAAVRTPDTSHPVEVATTQMMGLHVADRANRDAAGLPPRVHDLR